MPENLKISISGIRGIVGETLTPDRVIGWVQTWEESLPDGPIILARDARPHGRALNHLVTGILECRGRKVLDAGLVPTPTVGIQIRTQGAAGGIMLTASHNPVEWNALKLFNGTGRILSEDEFEQLEPLWTNPPPSEESPYKPGGSYQTIKDPLKDHLELIEAEVDCKRIASRGLRVVVDGCRSVGGPALPNALRAAGVNVIEHDCEPDGQFTRGLEPIPDNIQPLCDRVIAERAHLGMATDPDADRLALVSEKGGAIGEEYTLVLAAESVLARGGKGLVTNVSSTHLLDKVAARYATPIYRSKVGESHVVDLLLETGSSIGGEGNGGVIFPRVHPGRDALSGALLVIDLLAREDVTLSEKIATYPGAVMVKDKVPATEGFWDRIVSAEAEEWWEDATVDRLDGLKWIWEDRWIHLRPSNTEPIIRILAEGPTKGDAQSLIEEVRKRI